MSAIKDKTDIQEFTMIFKYTSLLISLYSCGVFTAEQRLLAVCSSSTIFEYFSFGRKYFPVVSYFLNSEVVKDSSHPIVIVEPLTLYLTRTL